MGLVPARLSLVFCPRGRPHPSPPQGSGVFQGGVLGLLEIKGTFSVGWVEVGWVLSPRSAGEPQCEPPRGSASSRASHGAAGSACSGWERSVVRTPAPQPAPAGTAPQPQQCQGSVSPHSHHHPWTCRRVGMPLGRFGRCPGSLVPACSDRRWSAATSLTRAGRWGSALPTAGSVQAARQHPLRRGCGCRGGGLAVAAGNATGGRRHFPVGALPELQRGSAKPGVADCGENSGCGLWGLGGEGGCEGW